MTNKDKEITACMDCLQDPCMCMQLMTGAFGSKSMKFSSTSGSTNFKSSGNVISISTPKYGKSTFDEMVMKISKGYKYQDVNPCVELLKDYKFIGVDMAKKLDMSTEWNPQPPPDLTVDEAIGNLMSTLKITPASTHYPEFGSDIGDNPKKTKYSEVDFHKAYLAYKKDTESKIAKELAKAKQELMGHELTGQTDSKSYKPTMFHTHGMDVLRCPSCGGIHLQQIVATVYERPEDNAQFGTVVKVTQEGAFSTEHLTGNPSPRRNAVVTQLRCEDCKSVLDFTLAHVKGSTVIKFTDHKDVLEDE